MVLISKEFVSNVREICVMLKTRGDIEAKRDTLKKVSLQGLPKDVLKYMMVFTAPGEKIDKEAAHKGVNLGINAAEQSPVARAVVARNTV